jgi:hypothetical protein
MQTWHSHERPAEPAPVPVLVAPKRTRHQHLTKTLVVEALAALGDDVWVQDLLRHLQSHDAAITHSLLSPMLTTLCREGLIERTRHGHYQVACVQPRRPFIAPAAVGT